MCEPSVYPAMKQKLAFLFLLLFVCASVFQAQAGGLIVVRDAKILPVPRPPIVEPPIRPPGPWPVPRPRVYHFAPMELQQQKVDIKVTDQFAETTVNQVFYNPNHSRLEGHFIFPIPKGALPPRISPCRLPATICYAPPTWILDSTRAYCAWCRRSSATRV